MKVQIEKLDHFGRGIAYLDHKICFIANALPGEVVDVSIVKEHKKYLEGRVEKYIKRSSIRILDECPYAKECGGCCLGHMTYEEENRWKEGKVREVFQKFTSIDSNIIKPIVFHERYFYRNKIVLHGQNGVLGLYQTQTHNIIPISKCLLVSPKINQIIPIIQKENNGIEEVIIKTSNDDSNVMVSIDGNVKNRKSISKFLQVFFLNGQLYTDVDKLLTKIGNKYFYESVSSFFQVNNTLTEKLYDKVVECIQGKNIQTALDLYCGTGTIGIFISEYVDHVIGIDFNLSNIHDANQNKELNSISNIEFICDKVENQISSFHDIDLVVVDPPREGLDLKTRNYLKEISPSIIVYVSCDLVTLARDINDLNDIYEVKFIQPFNMFPRTYHCESITVLERK